jgi:hypothetical protein
MAGAQDKLTSGERINGYPGVPLDTTGLPTTIWWIVVLRQQS